MDKATVVGLIVGIVAVFGGAILDDTKIQSLVNVPAFIIVLVGTMGATTLSYPLEDMIRLPKVVGRLFFTHAPKRSSLLESFVELATRARRDGVLSLESEAEKLPDAFMRRGIQLVVDGTDESLIREILEADAAAMVARHGSGISIFDTMGGFSPTLGIMGAVLGLIHVLSKVDDPTKLAAGIATAFVATLYGVGSANLVFFPFANKLRFLSEDEEGLRKLMIHGILAINAGDNPRVVRQKLESFLSPSDRGATAEKPSASAAVSPAPAPAAARR